MSNTRILITSDPYERRTLFARWDDEWVPIDSVHNPKSALITLDIANGFFPFKAEPIVQTIVNEYGAEDRVIEIVFEGSSDEYEELKSVCSTEEFKTVVRLRQGKRHLLNARDILPEIVRVFRIIYPLLDDEILQRDGLAQQAEQFSDASSDVIPLCVLGNYSSGKSTFINALIGQELLPSGDEPVTSRVYQIKHSQNPDHGSIAFTYNGAPYRLNYNHDGLMESIGLANSAPYQTISGHMHNLPEPRLISSMNRTLELLNSLDASSNGEGVSNKIDVTVPFCVSDSWANAANFVIFDTPGSNAVTRGSDAIILKQAMRGLTNGLPIYVSTYDALDTDANKDLYEEIASIDAVDERFAMIVVNKADGASLPKHGFSPEDISHIMDLQVPRTLYAQGIYFVSSIIALGEKIDGEFASDEYAEKYEDYYNKFSNPRSRFYRVLYSYNILPAHISERTIQESKSCDDLALANSGMYCVEQEIERFARRYSAYNKCQQSRVLLTNIIQATKAVMESMRHHAEESNRALKQALEQDKQQLLAELREACKQSKDGAEDEYKRKVDFMIAPNRWLTNASKLGKLESELTRKNQEKYLYDSQSQATKDAFSTTGKDFVDGVSNALNNPNRDSFASIAQNLRGNVGSAKKQREALSEISRLVDGKTSDDLLEEVRKMFEASSTDINASVELLAQTFWEQQSDDVRSTLYRIATGSSVLTQGKRIEIANIIIHYPALELQHDTDDIFTRANFEKTLRFLVFTLFKSEKLDLAKLAERYNQEIRKVFSEIKVSVKQNYKAGFDQWLDQLLISIVERITDYSPVLHQHVTEIEANTERIADLTRRLGTIERCSQEISSMMEWKD